MKGSIFIHPLCKELNKNWFQFDMGTIASKVNKTVMQKYERIQAPIFENQLGDLMFFTGDSSVIYAADAFTHYA